MSPIILNNPALYRFLLAFDAELAAKTRARDCWHRAGKLHQGGFDRKPRGCGVPDSSVLRAHQPRLLTARAQILAKSVLLANVPLFVQARAYR